MPRIAVEDVGLHVEVVGNGDALLLLHGFTGSGADWTTLVHAGAPRFRSITVDLVGHGRSDAPPDPSRYRMERCVADLAAVLDVLGVARCSCVGYSMGARIAVAFAVAHAERVPALVLEGVNPGLECAAERAARVAHDEALADAIVRNGIEPFVDFWMAQPLFASQRRLGAEGLAKARRARGTHRPEGLANSLRGMGTGAQPPLWTHLSALPMPVLLVVGEEDVKFRDLAAAMLPRLRRGELAIVPEAGHAAHLENSLAFNARVLAFLAAHAGSRSSE